MTFKAIRGRLSVDADGEVKITFIVSLLETSKLHTIPIGVLLDVTVEEERG